jgi:hypothetical protein
LLLHLSVASRYGYFGDELYFLACGEHLDWGYVDQPPLIGLVSWLVRHTLGTSLLAIRSVSALAAAALVWVTARIAAELGGGRFAQALAALCAAFGGVYLVIGYLFTMNAFEPLLWMGCVLGLIRIVKTGNQKLWLWFGLLAGAGLQNKYSMGVFGAAVVVALLLTPERKAFREKWIWLAGALAFVIFLPNLIWNIRHDWPFLELMRNIRASGRDVQLSPAQFLIQQIMVMNPGTFPVWLAGLIYLFFARDTRPFRVLGWTFVTVFAVFLALKGKDYYVSPAYPMIMAAGAVCWERLTLRRGGVGVRAGLMAILLAFTAYFLPLVLPILPVETYLRYQEWMPVKPEASEQSHRAAALPHHYAWQFGWEEMVAAVAGVYQKLPPEERKRAAILGNNYGQAGAVDLFGPKYGLPKAIGGHQSYYLWGPRDYTGEVTIVLGWPASDLEGRCASVEVAATLRQPYAAVWENRPILVCRGLKGNLREIWPQVKTWN